jgi:hypothetical protein
MALPAALIIVNFGICEAHVQPQKVETVNGGRIVHNVKGGKWGKNPEIGLELIRTLGGVEAKDENFAFSFWILGITASRNSVRTESIWPLWDRRDRVLQNFFSLWHSQ